jgi:TonB-dependent starch-binding outer membrane protein SusC
MFFYGTSGNEIVNYRKWWTDFPTSFQGRKSKDALYNSWTPTNTGATTPVATSISNISTNQGANSYFIEDGSYFRAKNIALGYTLPNALVKKIGLESARVSFQAVNLFTVTNYTGLNPELGPTATVDNSQQTINSNDQGFGVDGGFIPTVRQYIFGLNLKF